MAYDRVILRDLGSRNGVRVNGRIVEEVRLQPGDEVAIGPILYRFEGRPRPPSPPRRPAAPPGRVPPAGRTAPPGRRRPRQPGWVLDDADIDLSRWTTSERTVAGGTSRRLYVFGPLASTGLAAIRLRRNGFCVPCASRPPLC